MRPLPRSLRTARGCLPWLLLVGGACHAAHGQADTAPAPSFTLATLSLADAAPPWPQRRDAVRDLLARLRPDVVALQGVRQAPGLPNPACWLAARLGYSCDFITADPPSRRERRGSALLSRLPVEEDAATLLDPFEAGNAAGMLRLDLRGQPLNIYLARLYPDQDDDSGQGREIRAGQLRGLLTWVQATADGAPSLIVGEVHPGESVLAAGYRPATAALGAGGLTIGQDAGADRQVLLQRPLRVLALRTIATDPAIDADAHGLLLTVALPTIDAGDAPTITPPAAPR